MENVEKVVATRGGTLEKKESYFGCGENGQWEVEFCSNADNKRKSSISEGRI